MSAAPAIGADALDAIKGMFCDLVQRLEGFAPRPVILRALRDALQTERTVDEMIAAADAEDTSERK